MSNEAKFITQARRLRAALEPAKWLGLERVSEHATALTYLLSSLNWQGKIGKICEALPHMPGELDRVDLLNTMINLGYHARSTEISLHNFDPRLSPCLFVNRDRDERPLVLIPAPESMGAKAMDPLTESTIDLHQLPNYKGTVYIFEPLTTELAKQNIISSNVGERALTWFRNLIRRFDAILIQSFAVSFLINTLALASSLFVMVVYDKVIGSRSVDTLQYLAMGAILAMTVEALLRYLRARSLAYFGVRLDAITSQAVFERLLFLPPRLIEGSSIPSQVARMKDFDSIRDFFSSPTGISVLELPFTLIFLATIAVIGGPLALIPLVLAGCYALLALIMLPRIQASTERGASTMVRKQALLVETMQKNRMIKAHGLGDTWWQRFHELSGEAAITSFASAFQSSLIEAFAYGLSILAGVVTLTFGIWLAWQGQITTGGLIASMMLVWRILTPMQTLCNSLVRLRYIFRSIQQVHKLIKTPPEGKLVDFSKDTTLLRGRITFSGVGLRYSGERSPVISGLSLEIQPGEIVAITGGSGTGKSSVLKLVNGLYTPQIGSILIDGLDIRQRDPIDLRKNISYVPQMVELFHGTIEKNLRMVQPDASDEELRDALVWAGALEETLSLPKGLNTFIGDYRSEQLSSSFAFQLTLARGYLRKAAIMLFDEFPSAVQNDTTGALFREYLQKFRGDKTMVFVTEYQEDILQADRLVYLPGNGQVLSGAPAELLKALHS
ncbi:peptidase domain-containing ABC transporter [Desulfogranum mediterraneum]|uniref:peptidase domain-containing ABC transporter n=1 Tax=Desulfogranum mediterraneum TaxID=160661 RepID=UPI00041BDF2C|nr:ATP-binding cassette domain-containing protein [Desulfogranum mediterraneum]